MPSGGYDMRQMLEKILCCYGREMEIVTQTQSQTVRAFLQPVSGRGENMIRIGNTPLGREEKGQFVYIGPVTPAADEGDLVKSPEGDFILRRCEVVHGISGPAYRWGMCIRKGAEDTWGLNG